MIAVLFLTFETAKKHGYKYAYETVKFKVGYIGVLHTYSNVYRSAICIRQL